MSLQPQQQQRQQPIGFPREITYEMRLNYFKAPPPGPRARVYVIAVILLIGFVSFHNAGWMILCGLCFIPIIWRFVSWIRELNRPTMTDQEYDQWVDSYFDMVNGEGLDKFKPAQLASIVDSPPQTIKGFVYRNDFDAKFYGGSLREKRGEDNRLRSSVSRFIVIYLAEHEICVYIRDINALGDNCIKKDSSYYYYDVVGVSMDTYGYFGADGNDTSGIISSDYFAVKISSGDRVGMAVLSHDRRTEATVANLRKLLGLKKYRREPGVGGFPPVDGGGYGGNPNQYGGNPNQYGGNPNQYGGNPGGYEGNPNQYSGNTGGYGGNPNQYGGNPNQYGGNPNQYGGNPNQYSGNTYPNPEIPSPYPRNTGPYPMNPNPYPGNTDPYSVNPNPYPGSSPNPESPNP
jgi:hypothetical protein